MTKTIAIVIKDDPPIVSFSMYKDGVSHYPTGDEVRFAIKVLAELADDLDQGKVIFARSSNPEDIADDVTEPSDNITGSGEPE